MPDPIPDPPYKPRESYHVPSHFVENPAEILTGPDDEYIEPFKKFLAQGYGGKPASFDRMARILIARRNDLNRLQDEMGDAGSQGVVDLVQFAKQYKPVKSTKAQAAKTPTVPTDKLIKPFGAE